MARLNHPRTVRTTIAALAASSVLIAAGVASAEETTPPAAPPPAAPPPVAPPPPMYPPPQFRYPSSSARPTEGDTRDVVPYEGGVVELGYHLEERVDKGLVIAGISVFSGPYLLSLIVGAAALRDDNGTVGVLVVPVLGPFISAGEAGNSYSYIGPIYTAFMLFDGVTQAVGAGLLIAGIAKKKKYVVLGEAEADTAYEPELHVGPGSLGVSMKF